MPWSVISDCIEAVGSARRSEPTNSNPPIKTTNIHEKCENKLH